jgi:hypothetical protein
MFPLKLEVSHHMFGRIFLIVCTDIFIKLWNYAYVIKETLTGTRASISFLLSIICGVLTGYDAYQAFINRIKNKQIPSNKLSWRKTQTESRDVQLLRMFSFPVLRP